MDYNQDLLPVTNQPGSIGSGPAPGLEYDGQLGEFTFESEYDGQSGESNWDPHMALNAFPVGVPPGLEYLTQMEVQALPGTTIGYIKQDWHLYLPRFSIQGAAKETLMTLEGPCFVFKCCGDVSFETKCIN